MSITNGTLKSGSMEITQRFGRKLKSYVGTGMSREECDNFVKNVLDFQSSRIEELEEENNRLFKMDSEKLKEIETLKREKEELEKKWKN